MKQRIRALTLAATLAVALLNPGAQPAEIEYHAQQQSQQDQLGGFDRTLPDHGVPESEKTRNGELTMRAVEADHVIGRALVDAEGESLGSVNDLAVDFDEGRVAAIVVGYGGVLGIGKTLVAVPPAFLTRETADEGNALRMQVTREKLQEAPTFRWDAEEPWELIRVAARHFGNSMPDYGAVHQHVRDAAHASSADQEPQRLPMSEKQESHDAYDGAPTSQVRPTSLFQASSLLRSHVRESSGENVGRLDDFIVDLESGRIIAGIIGSGGLLGIGKTLHALPLEHMTLHEERKEIRLRLTREQLLDTPRYSARDGNLEDPQWIKDLLAYFEGKEFEQPNRPPVHVRPDVREPHHERQKRHQDAQERDLDRQAHYQEAPHPPEGQQPYPSPRPED